jgi:hypothetical protein
VIYLNGSYATRKNWRPVTAELGNEYRHITYDERARGRVAPEGDERVLGERGVPQPLVVEGQRRLPGPERTEQGLGPAEGPRGAVRRGATRGIGHRSSEI